MFLIPSESELLSAFRPRDRKAFEPPAAVTYPLVARDYYAWVDQTGVRAHLVLQEPSSGRLLGITFRRDSGGGGAAGRMCDWCHSYGSADEIGLLTADRSSRKRVGVLICRDLRCREKLEDSANLAGRASVDARRRTVQRMLQFAREALGIESVPADVR